jgi:hypothetical protein
VASARGCDVAFLLLFLIFPSGGCVLLGELLHLLVKPGVEHAAHVVDALEVGEERDEVRQLGIMADLRWNPVWVDGACEKGEGNNATYGSLNQEEMGTALLTWKT